MTNNLVSGTDAPRSCTEVVKLLTIDQSFEQLDHYLDIQRYLQNSIKPILEFDPVYGFPTRIYIPPPNTSPQSAVQRGKFIYYEDFRAVEP